MYEKAWQAFLADPTVMAGSLVRNATNYIVDLPILLFRQYTNVASISSEWIEFGVAAPILVLGARIKTRFYARALGFFVLVFLTTVASAAMIHAADGQRTLIVTNVLLSLALALGFAVPGAPRPEVAAAPNRRPLYLMPFALLLVFGLPALVKARVLYTMASPHPIANTIRIASVPRTPAVLVKPDEFPPDRSQIVVPSELLRQIGQANSYDLEFARTLDYMATNAPGTLLAIGWGQFLFGGADLLKHRDSDLTVQIVRANATLSRIDRWWPDSGQGGTQ